MNAPGTIRVLQATRVIRSTTNPYLIMLRRGLQDRTDVELIDFGYRQALFGRYDVWHLHWPENLLGADTAVKRFGRQLLLALVLLRLQVTGRPIVRTLHNLDRPAGLARRELLLLDWIDRLTGVWIRLNVHTPSPSDSRTVLIPHGHYRDWFAELPRSDQRDGQFGYVGLIRRYKGVERLIEAFRAQSEPVTLRIGGKPSTDELADTVRTLADGDPRIALQLAFLSDAELVELVTSSELVVLPYRFMHNSGGTLAALSLDRPVLVPDTEVNRELSAEVGAGWVLTFTGELDAPTLLRSLAEARESRTAGPSGRPDLSGREWSRTVADHLTAYRMAVPGGRKPR